MQEIPASATATAINAFDTSNPTYFVVFFKVNTEFSLALEVSQKVRGSISCLVGAYKMGHDTVITPFFHRLRQHNVQVKVILFLEGAFHGEIQMFCAMSGVGD